MATKQTSFRLSNDFLTLIDNHSQGNDRTEKLRSILRNFSVLSKKVTFLEHQNEILTNTINKGE